MNLRPYQHESVYQLIPEAFRAGHKRIIRCAPTGSGKSLEMAELTRLAYEKGNRTLLLTHRKELFKSTLAHLGNSGIPCASLDAGQPMPIGDWRVLLGMEKTIWNRIKKAPESILPVKLIIVDEGHFNNFTKIIEHFSDAYVVTFTATPTGKHISKLYTHIIDNIGIPQLIQSHYLTPCKPYMMRDEEGFDKIKKKGDDFDSSELFRHYDKTTRYKGVLDEYLRLVSGLKGMIFCVNVEHTIKTYETFRDAGVNTFLCHSKMSDAMRDAQVQGFERSHDGVMINCGILTTGFSHDPIRFIFVDRATTSISLWLQMQGRGSRVYPGKDNFIVCDFGDNHTRLGLWNQPREWSLDPPRVKKQQASPVKLCPGCSAMLHASARSCEFCDHTFPAPTSELREGVMCEVGTNTPLGTTGKRISELTLDDLVNLQRTKKMKASYVWRTLRSREAGDPDKGVLGVPCLSDYAKIMGYKNGWLYSERQKIQAGEIGFRDYVIR